ncbi:MAG: response regulator [Deltaproteobacteria bacterium]|nr:response regulator [Deltaproteobacteria bacterium]
MSAHSASDRDDGLQAESELRKFYLAAEQSPSQLVITNTKGLIEYANPRLCEVTGFTRDEIIGQTPALFKSGRMPSLFYRSLWDTLRAGQEWQGEFLNRRKDGSFYWERASIAPIKDSGGTITHFIKVAEDVTEQRRAEESQRRSLKLSEAITAANLRFIETGSLNQMAAVLLDTCMTITNSPFGLFYELRQSGDAGILALSLASFDPVSEETVFRDIQYDIRRNGHFELKRHESILFAPVTEGTTVVVNTPEENLWKGCTCPVCTPTLNTFAGIPLKIGTTVIGMLGLANREGGYLKEEIQEMENFAQTCALAIGSAKAELDRTQAREQLRQAQKMEAIGQLAGGIAHDFNNLLTVINGYSTLLLQKIGANEQMRKEVEQILSAGERASTLIRQLLAFGRRQMLEPRLLNINTLIASLHKILCRLIGENITLSTELATDIGMVRADPSQIEQIIMNLVINARDALDERGGSITVETANQYLDAAFARRNRGAEAGDFIMIAVRDTGMGMSEELIGRIFEPFFTTKAQGYGTGLGLATVYGIVKQSNGYIKVRSEVGMGSEFRIYLPRVAEGAEQVAAVDLHRRKGASIRDSGLILIVEDERAVLDLSATTLRSRGYDVLTASGPQDALMLFERHAGEIDLLLTDVMMPVMSGPEMVQRMLAKRPDLKVVFMSGYTDEKLRMSEFPDEQLAFIMKPFSPDNLINMISDSIRRPNGPVPTETPHE